MNSSDSIKKNAKKLRKIAKDLGYEISHSHALEIMSRYEFNQPWNVVANNKSLLSKAKDYLTGYEEKTSSVIEEFYLKNYINDLDSFRDKFNFGIHSDLLKWDIQDFTKLPNALFAGCIGCGKSTGLKFSLLTWLITNMDHSQVFIIDPIKGAHDHKDLFDLDQVYPIINGVSSEIYKIIELIYLELQKRKKEFRSCNAHSVVDYEKKKGKKINRIISIFEEFHSIPYNILNFDKEYKEKGTPAHKLHSIMREGRAFGLWVIASSQKATASDIPIELIVNFTNKMIGRISKSESTYLLGTDKASQLSSSEKGYFFSDNGKNYFPFVKDTEVRSLLKKYNKENTAQNLYISDNMIKSVFKELKPINDFDLKSNTEKINKEIFSNLFKKSSKFNFFEEIDNPLFSHIVYNNDGEKIIVNLNLENSWDQIEKIKNYLDSSDYDYCYVFSDGISDSLKKVAKEFNIIVIPEYSMLNFLKL